MAKKSKKQFKDSLRFIRKNYFLTIFISILVFAGIILIVRKLYTPSSFFYAKIEVSYPASYFSKPDIWMVRSLNQDEKQYNILGSTEAELLGARYYPNTDGTSFNIFLTVRLAGSFNKNNNEYTFQRSQIGVGSPITLNFSSTQLYGTVIDLSPSLFKDKYAEKTITLVARGAYYKDDPTLYNSIRIGDNYFDGRSYVFQITGKKLENNIFAVVNNFTGQVTEGQTDATQNIVVKANILVLEKDNQLVFAGDQILHVGDKFVFSTSNFSFDGFTITSIN